SGVLPVMKLLEDSFSYSNQLGQRQGAGVVYLNVFHPDIISFLGAKKENADEKYRVKTLSLGVVVPDKYYDLIKANADMYLFSPYSVERVYGKPFSYVDITKEYDNMVANPAIKKYKIKARDLENEISKLQQESGYPYIINIDTANRANPIEGKIIMSNLCSEIMQ
ncbi:ribonucleotide-diphosphate reductase subunit alpha, partial [Lacticaseibacillus paracasei]